MKNALLLSILAGGTAGLFGSAALWMLSSEPSTDSAGAALASAPSTGSLDPVRTLREELDRLVAENEMLSERLRRLEDRPVPTVSTREPVEAEPDPALVRLEDQMMQLLAAMSEPDAGIPSGLAEGFRDVYEDIQEEERAERDLRRQDAREMEMSARMDRYVAELGLDDFQTNEMRVILTNQEERRRTLFDEARETGGWMTMREDMRTIRDETEGELANVLSVDQLERYEEMDRGFGFGGGPRRGGDDGGTEGGGGGRRFGRGD